MTRKRAAMRSLPLAIVLACAAWLFTLAADGHRAPALDGPSAWRSHAPVESVRPTTPTLVARAASQAAFIPGRDGPDPVALAPAALRLHGSPAAETVQWPGRSPVRLGEWTDAWPRAPPSSPA
ncbi:hypothetical protein GCM10007036_06020 [Alsobacter metallidurans]|uniref:Secreted protein n=1 Tax=Alsobacter metallidurans TaxID=340221 RepID=A0A917I4K3_9HYPH|nr:hypothetical protein GCM10007036_06020 [Alsobacter metallidurans]